METPHLHPAIGRTGHMLKGFHSFDFIAPVAELPSIIRIIP